MNQRNRTLPFLAGAAATALLLSACGSDDAAEPPAPRATVTPTVAPTSGAPSTSEGASATAPPSASVPANARVDDRAELEVEDQRGDGRRVAVQEVRLGSGTGFVAIYTPENRLLGSAKVAGGGNGAQLTVDLDERIPATGKDYRAVLFADEGDGSFDPDTDLRVIEADDGDGDQDPVDSDFDYTIV